MAQFSWAGLYQDGASGYPAPPQMAYWFASFKNFGGKVFYICDIIAYIKHKIY